MRQPSRVGRAVGEALLYGLRLLRWLILPPLLALLWLLTTTSGLHAGCALALRLSHGALTIDSSKGQLLGAFSLQGLHWRGGNGSDVEVSKLELHWRPQALLHARLHVQQLDIDGLRVLLPPAPTVSAPASAPSLPSALAIGLTLDDVELRGFQLQRGGATTFQLEQASLAADWIGGQVEIHKLDAVLPETGALHLTASARLAGDRIYFDSLTLRGPGTVNARGTLGLGAVASDLQLHGQALRWPLVATDEGTQQALMDGNAYLRGTLDAWTLDLDSQGRVYQLPITLKTSGSGDLHGAHIDRLELRTQPREPKRREGLLQVSGPIAWDPVLHADLDAQLTSVDPGLFASDWNGSLNGSLTTRSQWHDQAPVVDFDLRLTPSTLRGYALQLTARGQANADRVRIDALDLQAAQGRVTAQGEVRWRPQLGADLLLALSGLSPGVFAPDWPGRISGTVKLATASAADGALVTSIGAQLDHSQLRNRPIALNVNGELRQPAAVACKAGGNVADCNDQLTISQLSVQSGTTHLDAHGAALPPFDLQGQLDSPDLAQLDPRLGGQVGLQFSLQGPLATPHLVTRGRASGLRYANLRLAMLRWDADVDPQVDSHIDLTASDGDVGFHLDQLKLVIKGMEVYHHAQIDAVTSDGAVSATLQGGYDRRKEEWGGELAGLTLTPKRLSPWSLEKGVGILIGARRLSIEPACLSADGGHLCVNLLRAVVDPDLQLSWSLNGVPLRGFQPLLPPNLEVDGRLDGDGQLHWLNGNIADTHGQLTMTGGRLTTAGRAEIDFQPSRMEITQAADRVHATLKLRAIQGHIDADLSAGSADRLLDRPLSGQFAVEVPDLSFLQPFVHELKAIGGRIDGGLNFDGTLSQPKISGSLVLDAGRAVLATPGIQLTDVSLRLKGAGEGPLAVEGELHSGGGVIDLAGSLDPALNPPQFDLKLTGKDFQALALPDARIWIAPELHLANDNDGISLAGTLTVPKAELTPQGLGDNPGVRVSRDQVLVGTPAAEQESPLPFTASVSFVLGNQVHFTGFGLTTRLEGAVDVDEVPGYDTAGQGELRLVDGHYKAYGQDLTIERGRLIFDGGPITQPAIDISAYRQPQSDVRVGVSARGTLDQPLLALYSDPAMPREQQLSWLLFGRPLEQNSSADRSMVSSAALSLGLGGGDFLMEQIGKRIGLDTVSVGAAPAGGSDVAADASRIAGSQASYGAGSTTTNTSQSAQLTLGKYLTPRIFVSYGVGLFQTGQTFRLLYDIGHGFKLQTETSTSGSGGDVIYTIDRGK